MKRDGSRTREQVRRSTGLSAYALDWILDKGGFAGNDTLQALAVAAGVELKEITRPDPTGCTENGIGFTLDGKTATVQFSQGRYKGRIRKLAGKHPEECRILAENGDGTLLAHIPVEWVKISPPKAVSEEFRQRARETMRAFHEKHGVTPYEKG